MRRIFIFLSLLFLAACSQDSPPEVRSTLNIGNVLGGSTQGFMRAEQARTFSFPEDHGMHAGFRNEWWYLTGNLETNEGRRFGYQLTFFNVALPQDSEQTEVVSAWQSDRIWMAHAALTDVENNQHYALERFSRENPSLAGAQASPFKVWVENWQLESEMEAEFPWHLAMEDEAFSLDLNLSSSKDLVLQGENGLSQKSPELGNASYYYSFTRLQTEGILRIQDEVFQLSGDSWLDREWSSSALAEDQTGWDWFSLQFDDGEELMYYQLRDADGNAHSNSQGNWTDAFSQQTLLRATDIQLEEKQFWVSPSGITYTTQWEVSYKEQRWIVQAVMDDQLMALSLEYWEGAVDIMLADSMENIGHGYLEMLRE
jgi:predicted secreted hydrolase